ncbi:MAG: hypothetical protein WD226_01750 [Planctomycetota bacterium]
MQRLLPLLALLLPITGACQDDHGHAHGPNGEHLDEADHDHAELGPHGGELIEVGAGLAHLELLHDEAAGSITLHALGADGVTPLELDAPPELKLMTATGPLVLPMAASPDTPTSFSATNPALTNDALTGRVSLTLAGKTYSPDLVH